MPKRITTPANDDATNQDVHQTDIPSDVEIPEGGVIITPESQTDPEKIGDIWVSTVLV